MNVGYVARAESSSWRCRNGWVLCLEVNVDRPTPPKVYGESNRWEANGSIVKKLMCVWICSSDETSKSLDVETEDVMITLQELMSWWWYLGWVNQSEYELRCLWQFAWLLNGVPSCVVSTSWQCLDGRNKRWNDGLRLQGLSSNDSMIACNAEIFLSDDRANMAFGYV